MDERDVSETRRLQELYMRRMGSRKAGGAGAHVTPEAILAVVQREGAESERLATLEHVMSCAACHREYEWLKAVNEAGVEHAGRGSEALVRRPWWQDRKLALAASLVMAVGAALAVRSVISPGPERVRGNAGDIVLITPATVRRPTGRSASAGARRRARRRYVLEIQRPDGSIAVADTTADTTVAVTDHRIAEAGHDLSLVGAGSERWRRAEKLSVSRAEGRRALSGGGRPRQRSRSRRDYHRPTSAPATAAPAVVPAPSDPPPR